MDYNAGDLLVNIVGSASASITPIKNTITALNRLNTAVKNVFNSNYTSAGMALENLFTKISNATKTIDTAKLNTLSATAKSLSSISKISSLDKMDFEKVGRGFNTLSETIDPFLQKVKSAEASLTALYGVLSKVNGKKIQNLTGGGTTSSPTKSGGAFGFLRLARWTTTIYMARRLARFVANIAQSGADYTESLNLWETSMGSNLTLATEFVNKMNEAYGISEKTLMNAQATFKNMLGSLGNITDMMAYQLSEGITQMAVDYASLYNQTFEQAFTKFQAALAGQVRPIRSVSGFDITEQTLFALYQSLGGEKTMRQLNRTEKQLLSILAIFRQMQATGTVGDLNKTMESFANQSRVMAESWEQFKSYLGSIITYLIQESGLLVNVNASLIFMGDVLKAVAESMNAIQHFGGDIFESTTESADMASEAIDNVKGKLLDFDKFRALESSENELDIGLDTKLLNDLANFNSILGEANMRARELADTFKTTSGLFNEDGTFNIDRWNALVNVVKTFGIAIAFSFSGSIINSIIKFALKIFTLKNLMTSLNVAIITVVVYSITKMIEAIQNGDIWLGIFAGTIAVTLTGAFIFLQRQGVKGAITGLAKFASQILITNTLALGSAGVAIFALTMSFIGLGSAILGAFAILSNWSDMNTWQRIIGIVGVATTAILGLAIAFGAFHSAWSLGLASAGIVAGIAMIVGSIASIKKDTKVSIPNYEMGASDIDSGTVFRAGENGKTEAIYSASNGKTNVANVAQMKSAFYQALVEYESNHSGGNQPIVVKIGENEVFTATRNSAKRQGLDFVKV